MIWLCPGWLAGWISVTAMPKRGQGFLVPAGLMRPTAGTHPGQGKRVAPAVVQARELRIPLLAAASKIHAGPHVASAARQSQCGP